MKIKNTTFNPEFAIEDGIRQKISASFRRKSLFRSPSYDFTFFVQNISIFFVSVLISIAKSGFNYLKKYFPSLIIIILFLACGNSNAISQDDIRKPAVSGQFYPSDKRELESMIKKFLDVEIKKDIKEKQVMGIIVPHAGYVYSGYTAGYGFNIIKGKKYNTVIILGSSHHKYMEKPTVCEYGFWETPIGKVKIDYRLLNEIKKKLRINIDNSIFVPEHCLEVEVPFLQTVLKDEFMILPILINNKDCSKILPYSILFHLRPVEDTLLVGTLF